MSRVFRSLVRAPRTAQVAKPVEAAAPLPTPEQLLAEASQRAALRLTEAREEAEALLEKAKAESAALREEAAEQGYRDGLEKGREEALSQAQDLIDQAEAALEQANQAYQAMIAGLEPKVLALALSTAKRIVSESLQCDEEVALELVRKGMRALRDEREFSVHCDPELMSILEGVKDDLGREFGAKSVEVVPDASAAGGALVVTPHGFVDVTIAAQVRNVAEALAEARKRSLGGEQ